MAIERIHFEGGHQMDFRSPTIVEELVDLATAHEARSEVLPPDIYRLTPEWWTKHTHEHLLTVYPTGTGLYTAVPRDNLVGILDSDLLGLFQRGGKHIPLHKPGDNVYINGILPDRKNLGVYDIVRFRNN